MKSKEKNDIILIQLKNDEDLFKSLKKICTKHKIKNGFIISGIGQLKNITLGYYKKNKGYLTQEFKDIYELLNLSGNICSVNKNYEFHIHTILSNENMKIVGGHLIEANVEFINEIIILKTSIEFTRIFDITSGMKKMEIKT